MKNRRRALWVGIVIFVMTLGLLQTTDFPLYTWESRPAPDTQETIVIRRNNFTGEVRISRVGPRFHGATAPQR